jgi:hypothetical protein
VVKSEPEAGAARDNLSDQERIDRRAPYSCISHADFTGGK